MTYLELIDKLLNLQRYQLERDVTVEIFDGNDMECFPGSLMICGENHDSLDEDHPVIYVRQA